MIHQHTKFICQTFKLTCVQFVNEKRKINESHLYKIYKLMFLGFGEFFILRLR